MRLSLRAAALVAVPLVAGRASDRRSGATAVGPRRCEHGAHRLRRSRHPVARRPARRQPGRRLRKVSCPPVLEPSDHATVVDGPRPERPALRTDSGAQGTASAGTAALPFSDGAVG